MNHFDVSKVMKAIDIFDKFRYSLASMAAIEVTKIGGNAGEASRRVLMMTDGLGKRWMSPRQMSMPLLERAGWMAYVLPGWLQREFETNDFSREVHEKADLVHTLGRAMVAVENHAELIVLLRARYLPYGEMSPAARQRIAIAGSTTQLAYLLATYVKELQYLPADQFARLLLDSGCTGRIFQFPDEEYLASHMDPDALVDAILRGFMLGHDMAVSDPGMGEAERDQDLMLTPIEVRGLAYYRQQSGFRRIDITKEFPNGPRHQSDSNRPIQIDQVHET